MIKVKNLRGVWAALLCAASWATAAAAIPQNYYSKCVGKSGEELLTTLYSTISNHNDVGYDGLWRVYQTSDVRTNGKVWDIYSTKEWTVGQEKCGSYKYVGDCINREHSVPQSWFSERAPMKSDAFHVYPTDGKVNGQRSNFPYGECANGTTLPSNGSYQALGKLGTCTFSGYSNTVFEPIDEYKGDLARTYFYMVACYNTQISTWGGVFGAGSYPGLKDWTLNLMLKWHRQDPVSQKERDRNEAIYNHQHNRNPFIDHPELVEHIWGTAKTTGWQSGSAAQPAIYTPVSGSTIDLGTCGLNASRSFTVNVKGEYLTSPVAVSVSGAGFSASTSTLTAATVMSEAGAPLTISYKSSSAGRATGTLTLTSGTAVSRVTLSAEALAGLPIYDATDVSETEFTVRWAAIDPAGVKYQLHVKSGNTYLPDYPANVSATAESFTVTDLTPGSRYTYWLTTPSGVTSAVKEVTTAAPIPSIQFLFDGDLYFNATPGTPSEVAEMLMDVENIAEAVTLTVQAPFQLSTDKTNWTTTIKLQPGEDRFYVRMLGSDIGTFSSSLVATAGEYMTDDVTLQGSITSTQGAFVEDFEAPSSITSYGSGIYEGKMRWNITAGILGKDKGYVHGGTQAFRTNKSATGDSGIEMAEPLTHGAGTVSFYSKTWAGESGSIALEYSTDAGITWVPVKTFDVTDADWTLCTADVKVAGEVRLRLMRASGKRIIIDDLEVSNYSITQVNEYEYHTWDAYCLDGQLVIENLSGEAIPVSVSSVNGAVWHTANISATTALDLPAGLYLVTSRGFTRKVMVK